MPATHAGPTPLANADRRPLVFTLAMILVAVSTSTTLPLASGQEADTAISAADVTAIRAAATAYRAALAKGDAAAIKAAWTEDGDTVDGWGNLYDSKDTATLSGTVADAAGTRPDVRMSETRLRLIARDVVIEDGTVDVILPGMKSPIEGSFTAIWARRGAGWKLTGLRESERPVSVDGDMLEDLDWMVGDWTLAIDGADEKKAAASMEMTVRWDAGHAFLIREVRAPVASGDGGPADVVEIHQRIGWDPLVKRIRSWSFSSDGSRSEATWVRDGTSWIATQSIVFPAGDQETAVSIYTYDGQNRCVWRTLPEGLELDDGRPSRATWIRKPGSSLK